MRRIIESTFVSLDGVIGDPMSWASAYFDGEAQAGALKQLLESDGMLMGRGTYEYFAPTWPNVPGDYAARINEMPKYIFSSTLDRADWSNSTIVRGDVVAAASELKAQDGQDLVIYGHGQLGQTFLRHGLLDELRLALHPRLVGCGQLLFRDGEDTLLDLKGADTLATGVVVLTYAPAEQ
jgi:dihydrofolate reductase